jgi:hypothetical protein
MKPLFRLRLPATQINDWAGRYDYDDKPLAPLVQAVNQRGFLTQKEFLTVCRWKTPRSQPRCQKNSPEFICGVTKFRQDGGLFIQILRRPAPTGQVAGQVTGQVAITILAHCRQPRIAKEIQSLVDIRHRETSLHDHLNPPLKKRWLRRSIPSKPTSRLQRYLTTAEGNKWLRKVAATGQQL